MSYCKDNARSDDNTRTELKISGIFDRSCFEDTDDSDDGVERILVVGRSMLFSDLHRYCGLVSTGIGTNSLKEVFLLIFGLVGLDILSDLRHCWSIVFLDFLMRIQVGLGLVFWGLLFLRLLLFDFGVSFVDLVGPILSWGPGLDRFSLILTHLDGVNEYILEELILYKARGSI